jgi:hypothetical protein
MQSKMHRRWINTALQTLSSTSCIESTTIMQNMQRPSVASLSGNTFWNNWLRRSLMMENFHLQLMEQDNPFAIVSLLPHCQPYNYFCIWDYGLSQCDDNDPHHQHERAFHTASYLNTCPCCPHNLLASWAKAATKIAYTDYEDSVVHINSNHQMFGKGSGWTYFSQSSAEYVNIHG